MGREVWFCLEWRRVLADSIAMKEFTLCFVVSASVILCAALLDAIPIGILIIVSLSTLELIRTLFKKDLGKLMSALIVVAAYLSVTFLYGNLYYFLPKGHIVPGFEESLTGFADAIYFSFVTVTTLGYGDITPITSIGRLIVVSQLIVGILMIVLGLNYIIGGNNK